MGRKLGVAIVTYNNTATITRCLESLTTALSDIDASVIIVDNASRDGTADCIDRFERSTQNVRLIRNPMNRGFAAAVNQAVHEIGPADFYLLLNPDTEIVGDVVRRTLDWMSAHPTAGVAGPLLRGSDGNIQRSIRRFPTFWLVAAMMLKLHKVFPNARVFRTYMGGEYALQDKPVAVDQIMGAAFFIRGRCWDELVGMDERFFLWFEEVDFCKRARDAGWGILWLPYESVRHLGAASFRQRSPVFNQIQFFVSAFRYLAKHRRPPPPWFDPGVCYRAAALAACWELISFWGYRAPWFGSGALIAIAGTSLVAGLIDPVWPIALVMAELALGSKGYGLSLPMTGGLISIRMALFAVAIAVGALEIFKTRGSALRVFFRRERFVSIAWMLLTCFVVWAALRGALLGNPSGVLFLDGSPWLFILFLPIALSTVTSVQKLRIVTSIMIAAATVLAAKTLFALYIFTHDYELLLSPVLYRWLRDTGVAEVTRLGANQWRIFAQSHLYTIVAVLLWIAMGTRGGASAFWGAAFGAAAIFISLSRSFWFGIAASGAVLFMLPSARRYLHRTIHWHDLGRSIGAVFAGVALLVAAAKFPIPAAPSGLNLSMFSDRISGVSDEAAARSRWALLPELERAVARSPLLGSGFGSTVRYKSADPRVVASNADGWYAPYRFEWGYLDVWLKMGVGGLISLLLLVGSLVWGVLVRLRGRTSDPHFLFGLLSGLLMLTFTHIASPYLNHPLGIGYLVFVSATLSVL